MIVTHPVNLKIPDTDWGAVKKTSLKLIERITGSDHQHQRSGDNCLIHSFGDSSNTILDHLPSKQWYRIMGQVVSNIIPWMPSLLSQLSTLKPDLGAISFMKNDGAGHIDLPEWPSVLHFIISYDDPMSYTWFGDNREITLAPTRLQPYISNTQVLHGVKNTADRWSVAIHFQKPFEEVSEWFDKNKISL